MSKQPGYKSINSRRVSKVHVHELGVLHDVPRGHLELIYQKIYVAERGAILSITIVNSGKMVV